MRLKPFIARRLVVLATIGAAAWAAWSGPAAPARAAAADDPAALRHPVEIENGRRLNVVCAGDRGPSIVFANGLGSSILDWKPVQAQVSRFARACVYDRAGAGYSDPSPKPASASYVVEDLHALLEKGVIAKPVIIVGHSAGGLFATLYAERYPKDVAGMVLVDPSFANQFQEWARLYPAQPRQTLPMLRKGKIFVAQCARMAREGGLQLTGRSNCEALAGLSGRTDLTPAELAYLSHQATNPAFYETLLAEEDAHLPLSARTDQNSLDEAQAPQSLGDMPLTVLTSGVKGIHGRAETPEQEDAWKSFWKAGHERLARKSSRGEAISVPDAGHLIQKDQPEVVVTAIRKVLEEAAAAQRLAVGR